VGSGSTDDGRAAPLRELPSNVPAIAGLGRLGGIPALALGFAGGVVGLVAIVRRGGRAVSVFAALVPFVNAVVFLLVEFLVGHD
jgi:hypothetical protein